MLTDSPRANAPKSRTATPARGRWFPPLWPANCARATLEGDGKAAPDHACAAILTRRYSSRINPPAKGIQPAPADSKPADSDWGESIRERARKSVGEGSDWDRNWDWDWDWDWDWALKPQGPTKSGHQAKSQGEAPGGARLAPSRARRKSAARIEGTSSRALLREHFFAGTGTASRMEPALSRTTKKQAPLLLCGPLETIATSCVWPRYASPKGISTGEAAGRLDDPSSGRSPGPHPIPRRSRSRPEQKGWVST